MKRLSVISLKLYTFRHDDGCLKMLWSATIVKKKKNQTHQPNQPNQPQRDNQSVAKVLQKYIFCTTYLNSSINNNKLTPFLLAAFYNKKKELLNNLMKLFSLCF